MSILINQVKRNVKMFFKDKGMFFTSLITPAILLVLYVAFLVTFIRIHLFLHLTVHLAPKHL